MGERRLLHHAQGGQLLMRQAAGFTLIELMITIAIGAILIVIGVPTMRGVIENGRIRAAGESWKYGLALARTEAIRRNTQVEFVSDADGWQVLIVADGTVLHQAAGNEGACRPGIHHRRCRGRGRGPGHFQLARSHRRSQPIGWFGADCAGGPGVHQCAGRGWLSPAAAAGHGRRHDEAVRPGRREYRPEGMPVTTAYQVPRHPDRGSALVEVLVSVLLFSVGILGLVRLLGTAVKDAGEIEYRAQAATIADEQIGRMWLDRSQLATYVGNTTVAQLPSGTRTVAVNGNVVTVTIGWQPPGGPASNHVVVATLVGN